jgi:chemotaxis protein histidine kinase CheA
MIEFSGTNDLPLTQDRELIVDFTVENREHLRAIEANLLRLERNVGDADALDGAFREFHTIKALAGFLEFKAMEEVAHEVETILDQARAGQIKISPEIIDVIFQRVHYLEQWTRALEISLVSESRSVKAGDDTYKEIRMMPVGRLFQRMSRVVRDLSRRTGKKVELCISGEDLELDRDVLEQLADPLMHMLRNAIDHGIEPPEDRVALGKLRTGRVALSAALESGNITIQVSDDGRGLDRQRILTKAVAEGLIAAGEHLSDAEVYRFIFQPGFSTARHITYVSGRGVGMDVVRCQIEKLGGRIEIESTVGRGTTFYLKLRRAC